MIERREFLTLLGASAATWSLAATAQQSERVRRVGVLSANSENDPSWQAWRALLEQGLQRLGWLEGRNLRIDYRFAPGFSADQAQPLARGLIVLQPDVIVAVGPALVSAMQRETRVIPIVFIGVSDPIGARFIDGLARPGGNITGFLNFEASIAGKWLAMLKEIAPRVTRAALLSNPKTSPYDYFLRAAEAAAPSLAIEVVPTRIETAADIEHAIESFARVPNGGLILPPDSTTAAHYDLIVALAARHRLPGVSGNRSFVAAGGLMSYDSDRGDQFRLATAYIDRILRGAKPADLPAQAPVKYETILNLKTAKALGLTVPDLMLVRADELIE